MENLEGKDVSGLMKRSLPQNIFSFLRKVGVLSDGNGFSSYMIGGCVRDMLLKRENLDLDIVVEGNALAFVKLLKHKFNIDAVTHPRFATATLILGRGFKIDVSSARSERYTKPAALPVINLSFIKKDLSRRDFSINTLAVKLGRREFGRMLDLFCGEKDIKAKKIKVLHDKSFIDDPTRIFRAVRFEQRFNFNIDAHTESLIVQSIKSGSLKKLSRFRLGTEIILILKEKDPLKSLIRLDNLGALKFVHGLIKVNKNAVDNFRSCRNVLKRFQDKKVENWLVFFMLLTVRLDIGQTRKLCRDFSLKKLHEQKVVSLKKRLASLVSAINAPGRMPAHCIYQLLDSLSLEENIVLLSLIKTKKAKERIYLFLDSLSRKTIHLTGKDLCRLGVSPGPVFKKVLKQVFYAKLDGLVNSKSDELEYARELLER